MKESFPQQAYDTLSDAYAQVIDTKPHNAYYDRPAIKSLVGSPHGQRVLDAGCGPGVYTQWLLDEGASVVSLDANEKMLSHAKNRIGEKATFIHANLEEPMPFLASSSFDGILSALTITYCKDLKPVFSEFSRILKPEGYLVFSTEHPFFAYRNSNLENYYEIQELHIPWKGFSVDVVMDSYYHSLSSITEALFASGFVIERMIEPYPIQKFAEKDPKGYEKLMKFPLFLFVRAIKR